MPAYPRRPARLRYLSVLGSTTRQAPGKNIRNITAPLECAACTLPKSRRGSRRTKSSAVASVRTNGHQCTQLPSPRTKAAQEQARRAQGLIQINHLATNPRCGMWPCYGGAHGRLCTNFMRPQIKSLEGGQNVQFLKTSHVVVVAFPFLLWSHRLVTAFARGCACPCDSTRLAYGFTFSVSC